MLIRVKHSQLQPCLLGVTLSERPLNVDGLVLRQTSTAWNGLAGDDDVQPPNMHTASGWRWPNQWKPQMG